jgi:hypothetical protein
MPLVLDVMTAIDERSAAAAARQLEHQFDASGEAAGTSFGAKMVGGIAAGFQGADFDSMLGVLGSAGMAGQALTHGKAIGAAFAGGIVAAGAAGIVDLGVKIGETFEGINRDITLHTAASGKALDELKSHADALVGALDSSAKSVGDDYATLATRLQTTAGPALDQLTQHVEMLRDRMGDFNVGALAGAFNNMGVTAANADDTLAALAQTVQRTDIPLSELATTLAANTELFKDMHLTAGQAGNVIGELSAKGIPATTALMGLQMAMKKTPQGEDFATYIKSVADALDYFGSQGPKGEAAAEQISVALGGPRKWTDLSAAAHAYLDTAQQGAAAFAGHGEDLTRLGEQTKTLGNYWDEVKNKISSALAPGGLTVTDEVGQKMESLIGFIDAHATDLRQLFETSLSAIGAVVEGLGQVAVFLGAHPALIEAVAVAFGTWTAIRGVSFVLTGLEAVGAWLVGAPALAAAAGAGIEAAAATTGAAVAGTAAGAATAATASMGALEAASAAGLASVTAAAAGANVEVAASAAAVATAAAEAAAAVAAAAGTGVGALEAAVAAGTASVIAGAAEADAAVAAGAAVAATAVTTSMTAADAAVIALNTSLMAVVDTLAAIATSPAVVVMGSLAALFGIATATGSATGQEASPDNLQSQPALGADGQPLTGPDGKPIMVGPGKAPGPAPGTGRFAPGQGPDVGGRAGPGLPGAPVAPGGDTGSASSAQALLDSLDPAKKGPKGPRLPEAPQVPYGAGYGAPPGPGESAEQYSKQQDILAKRHEVDEATARLNQLEQANGATADDIQKARNALLHAQQQEYSAELGQVKNHTADMEQLGAKIDNDFGISKGLPGIAENLTKFLANLAFAPAMGAMAGTQAGLGFPGGQGLGGGKGLVGMAGLSGMFGPQFTTAGGAGGGRGGRGGGGGASTAGYTTPSLPSIGNPQDLAGASGGVANLFRVAESLEGTPYSTQLRNDCSGMVSKLATAALGLPPSVQFDTTTEGPWLAQHGFQPGSGGPGALNIGWNPQPGMAGHTAATLPGGVNAEQGGSTPGDRFTLGPSAAGASNPEFSQHAYLPMRGYAEGGTLGNVGTPAGAIPRGGAPSGTDTVPAMLSPGEHVLTTQDVNAMGGQQGVYDFRAGLHAPTGPQPSTAGGSGATSIGGLGAMKGLGSGFTVTGGGLIGVAESIPATAASMAMSFAAHGGAAEDLKKFAAGGAVSYFGDGGAGDQGAAGAGGAGAAGPGAGPGAAGAAGAAAAGGLGAAGAASGTGTGTGAGGGGAPGGSVIGAAIGIGIQEMNEAISKSSQMAGALVGGLQQTFGAQQFAQTPLAQTGWLSRIVGGIAGAQPQLPNMGGQSAGKASPEGVPGMSPMAPPSEVSPFGPGRGPLPGPSSSGGVAPVPTAPAPPPPAPSLSSPKSALGDAGAMPNMAPFQGPNPNSVVGVGPAGPRGFAQGGDVSGGTGGGSSMGPAVHIENYNEADPNSAGQDIARHVEASYSAQQNSGSR